MYITSCSGQTARAWASVSSVAALQIRRRRFLCLCLVGQLRSVRMRVEAPSQRFCIPDTSRQDVLPYPSCALPASLYCGQLCVSLGSFCSPHHYRWTCEARAAVPCPLQQPFEKSSRQFVPSDIGYSEVNTCTRCPKCATSGEPSRFRIKDAGSEVLRRTKIGVFPQKRSCASVPVRATRGVARKIAGAPSAEKSDRPWMQKLKEDVEGDFDYPISLNDEAGRESLLMSRAAVQRLQTICARRLSQESAGGNAGNGGCLLCVDGRVDETVQRSRPHPVVGLQVRVTSGGCSGYQYSFDLLTSEEVQKLRGNKEYSVFWPPCPLNSPRTPTPTESGPGRTTHVVQSAIPPSGIKGFVFQRDAAAKALPATTETANEGAGIGKQEKEKGDTLPGRSEKKNLPGASGWCVLVDRCSLPLFGSDTVIDFEDTLAASEFVVQQNDRAENVCSCGRSFALKDEF